MWRTKCGKSHVYLLTSSAAISLPKILCKSFHLMSDKAQIRRRVAEERALSFPAFVAFGTRNGLHCTEYAFGAKKNSPVVYRTHLQRRAVPKKGFS